MPTYLKYNRNIWRFEIAGTKKAAQQFALLTFQKHGIVVHVPGDPLYYMYVQITQPQEMPAGAKVMRRLRNP